MTPEERAEKILEWIDGFCSHFPTGRCLKCRKEGVAAEIRAALEEVLKSDSYRTNIWKAAQAKAYEDAAKIVEGLNWHQHGLWAEEIAKKIRSRAAEANK